MRERYGETRGSYATRLRQQAAKIAEGYEERPAYVLSDKVMAADINAICGRDPVIPLLSQETDVNRGGRGCPLALDRFYSTSLTARFASGLFGRGWHSTLETRLVFESETRATCGVPGESLTLYTRENDKMPWTNDLTPGSDYIEGRRVVTKDGAVMEFDEDGRLVAKRDGYGNGLALSYDEAGRLVRIVHTDGQSLDFAYDGDAREVCTVTDDLGRRFAYEYDRSGGEAVLTRVTSDGKDIAYGYHDKDATAASLALNRVAVPGLPALDIEWNGAGQVVSTTVGDRFTTEYVREDDVCRKIEPGGAVTVYRTNPFGRIVSVTNPEGHTMRQIYDEDGAFLNQIVTPSGARTGFSYTPWGGLYEKTLPGGGKEQFRYDDHGNLTQVTDADGKVRRFSYNACGQMTFTASADGVAKYVTYDAENGDCLSCLHYGDKTGVAFGYNARGQVTSIVATNTTRRVDYTFDEAGKMTAARDSTAGQIAIGHDATNRIVRYAAGGHAFDFSYDGFRGLSRMTDENGRGERVVYDALGRVKSVVDAQDPERVYVTNHYDDGAKGSGRLLREVYGNGVETVYSYDAAGRISSLVTRSGSQTLVSLAYGYDQDGRLVSLNDIVAGKAKSFGYDVDGQLVRADYGGSSELFSYDAAGNRRDLVYKETRDETTGNLLRLYGSESGVTVCGYDEFQRLCAVTNETTGVYWSCLYDASGARARVTSGLVTTERVSVPTVGLVDEYEGGVRVRHHVRANGRRVAVVTPTGVRYLHHDHLGSIRVVTDENGAVTGKADFKAFGEVASSSGADAGLCGWIAAYGVETDPTGFHYMQHRYYSAQLGRFISEDPLGLEAGDVNFRRYCFNNPLGFTDPTGLFFSCSTWHTISCVANVLGAVASIVGTLAIAACPAVAVAVIVVSMACSATSMIADRWTSDEFPTASVVGGVSSIALSVLPGMGAVRGGLELAVLATSYGVSVYSANEACKASRQARLREGRR